MCVPAAHVLLVTGDTNSHTMPHRQVRHQLAVHAPSPSLTPWVTGRLPVRGITASQSAAAVKMARNPSPVAKVDSGISTGCHAVNDLSSTELAWVPSSLTAVPAMTGGGSRAQLPAGCLGCSMKTRLTGWQAAETAPDGAAGKLRCMARERRAQAGLWRRAPAAALRPEPGALCQPADNKHRLLSTACFQQVGSDERWSSHALLAGGSQCKPAHTCCKRPPSRPAGGWRAYGAG